MGSSTFSSSRNMQAGGDTDKRLMCPSVAEEVGFFFMSPDMLYSRDL